MIVLDGQTVVLGGLLREVETQIKQKIPLLGDIPILGELFKYTDESMERKELLAFITPTVVHRPTDNYDNYNREDLIRLEEVAQPLAEQISEMQELNLNITERISAKNNLKRIREEINADQEITPPDQQEIQTEIDSRPIDPRDLRNANPIDIDDVNSE